MEVLSKIKLSISPKSSETFFVNNRGAAISTKLSSLKNFLFAGSWDPSQCYCQPSLLQNLIQLCYVAGLPLYKHFTAIFSVEPYYLLRNLSRMLNLETWKQLYVINVLNGQLASVVANVLAYHCCLTKK